MKRTLAALLIIGLLIGMSGSSIATSKTALNVESDAEADEGSGLPTACDVVQDGELVTVITVPSKAAEKLDQTPNIKCR